MPAIGPAVRRRGAFGRERSMAAKMRGKTMNRKKKITVIIVSHNMDDIARMAERVVFMHEGRVLLDAPPSEAFFAEEAMKEAGLQAPSTVTMLMRLREAGLEVEADAFTAEEAAKRIAKAVRKKKGTAC